MRTQIIDRWSQLDLLASSWDDLAGPIAFRQRAWLESWWREYGVGHELFLLALHSYDGRLVGLAPWYIEDRGTQRRVIRMLGSGEVCSEYVTLLARPGCETMVGQAVGAWLMAADANSTSPPVRWDQVELSNVPASDPAITALRSHMAAGGYTVHVREGLACWRLALPQTWDQYTASLSRGNRRRMRDSQKRLQKLDAVLHSATSENFEQAWSVLVDLHQQRWTSQGEKGCFASGRFGRFLLAASQQMLARGTLRLLWIELGGRPASCAIAFCESDTYYVYQTGMATECLAENPGWLIQSAAIREAIEKNCSTYDLLRGNEPYKGHLGAKPLTTLDIRIVSRRLAPQLRHTAWVTGNLVKSAIKSGLSTMGMLSTTGIVQ